MAKQKVKDGFIRRPVTHKFRVGVRDTGKGAHQMSTSDLQAALERADVKKYHHRIRQVLATRADSIRAHELVLT